MTDPTRITKVAVEAEVEHADKPARITKVAAQADIVHGHPVIIRLTKAAVEVEIATPWARERYGPRAQVI